MLAVSAGHHLKARGAHDGNGFYEYPETQWWAEAIVEFFNKEVPSSVGRAFFITPGSLTEKVKEVNKLVLEQKVRLAIEIHFNSAPGGGAKGAETLYCPGSVKGEKAAKTVHDRYSSLFLPNRGIKEGWYKMDRPGYKDYEGDVDGDEKPDYFLRMTTCPALILEPEFIQHRDSIEDNREEAVKLIAQGAYKAALLL